MPSSHYGHISRTLEHICMAEPRSILDVGVGFGKWGTLCREILDVGPGRYTPEEWKIRIDGVEAFPAYRNNIHDTIYNHVYYSPIQEVLPSLGTYDVVIMGDVIEHLDKPTGWAVLNGLMARAKYVLISSPIAFSSQEYRDNPFEQHHSLWGLSDFSGLRFVYDEYGKVVFVALIEGELPHSLRLDPRPSQRVYRWKFAHRHSKLAFAMKELFRSPGYVI